MSFGDRLAFLIGADGVSTTIADFKKVGESAKVAAATTQAEIEKLTKSAEAAATRQAAAMDKVARGIGGASGVARNQGIADKAGAEEQAARQRVTQLEGSGGGGMAGLLAGEGASGAAFTAGITAAGVAVAAFAADGVKNFMQMTEAVRAFQATSGATAEQASRLTFALKALGVPTEAVATAIYRLGANAEQTPQKFARFGVEIAHTKTGAIDLVQTFDNVIKRMNELGPGALSDALAKNLVGRGAQTLAPLAMEYDRLIQLQREAKGAGAVFSQDDENRAEALKVSVAELGIEFKAMSADVGRTFVPLLTEAAHDISDLVSLVDKLHLGMQNANKGGVFDGKYKGPWKEGALIFRDVSTWLDSVAGNSHKASQAAAAATVAANEYAKSTQQLAIDLQNEDAAQKQTVQATDNAVSSLQAVIGARDAATAAAQHANDVDGKTPGVLGAVAQKAQDVASAERNMGSAQETLDQATQKLNDDLETTAERHDKLALSARSAANAVLDAQDAYRAAVDEYGAGSRQAQEAADAVTSAQFNASDAQRALNKPDTTVADDQRAVAAARQGIADAQLALNKALNEDPTATVAAAHTAYGNALDAEKAAADKLQTALKDGNVDVGLLGASLQSMYDNAKAAGEDPATLAFLKWLTAMAEAITGNNVDLSKIFAGPGSEPWQVPGSPASVGPNKGAPPAPTPPSHLGNLFAPPSAGQPSAGAPPGAGGTPGHTGGVQEAALVAPTIDKSITLNLYGSQATPTEFLAAATYHQAVRG